jgi:putative aldouronate transport system permease protein
MFMLIFRMAAMFNVDAAKILIMYNPLTYETADVFSTYVYRVGLQGANFGMGTAVSFMNALVSLLLLVFANWSSKKLSETSLW